MKVITFYSYKGGVGRSTSLCNIAYALSRKGKKIAVVDFDIESSGLYAIVFRDVCPEGGKIVQNMLCSENQEILKEIVRSSIVKAPKSSIYVLPAGIDHDSTKRVHVLMGIERKLIFQNVQDTIDMMENEFEIDYLFCDSRAGISNMAEPAFTFSDMVILVYRLGIQQQIGIEGLMRWLIRYYLDIDRWDVQFLLLGSNIHPEAASAQELNEFVEMIIESKNDILTAATISHPEKENAFPIINGGIIWQDDFLNKRGASVLFNLKDKKCTGQIKKTMELYEHIADLI